MKQNHHQDMNINPPLPNLQFDMVTKTPLVYAQAAHIIASNYDIALVFYQFEPQKRDDGILSYDTLQKEVARIVMPKSAAEELMAALNESLKINEKSTSKKKTNAD